MFERFTERARKVMALANQEALRLNHEHLGTEHVLLGLVKEGSGVGVNTLKNLNVDLRKVRLEVEKLIKSGPDMVTMRILPQTPRAKKVIEYAIEESRNFNHNYVGTEHILLGLLREREGVAVQVLLNFGLKLDDVRDEVLKLLGVPTPRELAGRAAQQQAFEGAYMQLISCLERWGRKVCSDSGKNPELATIQAGLVWEGFGAIEVSPPVATCIMLSREARGDGKQGLINPVILRDLLSQLIDGELSPPSEVAKEQSTA